MQLSEKKKRLVEELSGLYKKINVSRLYCYPKQEDTQKWLASVVAIFKQLDETDYQKIYGLSKSILPTENRKNRKKAAYEIRSFVLQKIAEYRQYDFSYLDIKKNPLKPITNFIKKSIEKIKNKKNISGQLILGSAGVIIVLLLLIWGYTPAKWTVKLPFLEGEFQPPKEKTMNTPTPNIKTTPEMLEKTAPLLESNTRPLEPLETGKDINKLPNQIYGFVDPEDIVYNIKYPETSLLKLSNQTYEKFEIQKINNIVLVVGYIDAKNYTDIGEISDLNPIKITVFPKEWSIMDKLVAIPLQSISEADWRRVDTDKNQSIYALDLIAKKVINTVIKHTTD